MQPSAIIDAFKGLLWMPNSHVYTMAEHSHVQTNFGNLPPEANLLPHLELKLLKNQEKSRHSGSFFHHRDFCLIQERFLLPFVKIDYRINESTLVLDHILILEVLGDL
eukprot:gnl/TRDRNA2_/TRDRNA2_162928_c0_seq2.p1 gnl/TRDRNA2_/TRDRNA2_162928_c0~~gnl/TRDRNA2_/TRDRNA2_162928_c0_seq2.p1  ORF type:complete len:108 (+),score=17.35 gnl/TRDRNA2_/TRDRNA2_162928_c0_seq2:304-627(+)